jgi:flagellar biosynthesis/type III secretory pathway M-ring protein FliF/YscJ
MMEEPEEEPSLGLPRGNLAIGITALIAVLLALWALRRLVMVPPLRRRIEEILVPTAQLQLATTTAAATTDTSQQLPATVAPAAQLEEHRELSPYDELRERVRKRLDAVGGTELSEEQLLIEEMKERIAAFIRENNPEAIKLIKSMITQDH